MTSKLKNAPNSNSLFITNFSKLFLYRFGFYDNFLIILVGFRFSKFSNFVFTAALPVMVVSVLALNK